MKTKISSNIFTDLTILLLLGTFLAACRAPATPPTDAVSVQLSWLHYGGFGGLYAAEQNGSYAEQSIDVSFIEGGPEFSPVDAVASGQAHFGIASADTVLLARAEGKPVRAIASIYRQSPVVLISLAHTGISSPEHIISQKVRVTNQTAPSYRAMMARLEIPPDRYQEVVLPSDLDLFVSGEVPVWAAFFNSFAVSIQEAGYEINYIFPNDYGVYFYGDVIFTSDSLIEQNPDLISRFLSASLDGWRFAIEDPEAVGQMVTIYDEAADAALETEKMRATILLVHTGQHEIGWMEETKWQEMHDTLLDQEILPHAVDLESIYTMQFLHDIYGELP